MLACFFNYAYRPTYFGKQLLVLLILGQRPSEIDATVLKGGNEIKFEQMEMYKLGIACDHAGYEMKEALSKFLREKGYSVADFGTNSTESVDYPDYAHPLASAVEKGEIDFGISICGSGNGINMTMNKHQGVRAALCWNAEIAGLARLHNNANACSLPARFISLEVAKDIVERFLSTEFEGGRHQLRIDKIAVK